MSFTTVSTTVVSGTTRKGKVVGYDIVEVVAAIDPHDLTSKCVARLTLNLMGVVWRARTTG